MAANPRIAGYTYGEASRSPVTMDELRQLLATVGFTDADRTALRALGEFLVPEAEALVDGWRQIIGSQPHLAHWFVGADGKADDRYKAAVRPRFVQWVVDLCTKDFDQDWLDYQQEIGLRHTPAKKNETDHAATPTVVPLRYLLTFIAPVLQSPKNQLRDRGIAPERVERMHAAWTKAVLLSVTLWTRPYTRQDLW